ncbi:MAG: hypothetical protein SW019_10835, partial [Actinomycetota bacterium]|nr:hypothetical protein [Actinomycetota bacterium]
MAKHARNRKGARSLTVRSYLTAGVTAGVTGAAMAGVGTLMLADGGATVPAEIEVQLVSNEEELIWPLALNLSGGSDQPTAAAVTDAAAIPVANIIGSPVFPFGSEDANGFNLLKPFGDGGWLIGNGLDAADTCEGSLCNGGAGGILWGNGGDGAHGG